MIQTNDPLPSVLIGVLIMRRKRYVQPGFLFKLERYVIINPQVSTNHVIKKYGQTGDMTDTISIRL